MIQGVRSGYHQKTGVTVVNSENLNDEVSIAEIASAAWRYKWLLLAGPVVGGMLAVLLVAFVLSPLWQASASLEVGSIAGKGKDGVPLQIEETSTVVSRMKNPSFPIGSLKVIQEKDTGIINLSILAESPEMAKKLMLENIAKLQLVHSEMMFPSIDRYRKQLLAIDKDIQNTSAEIELLRKKLFAHHDWNTFDATLSAKVLQDKTAGLRDMQASKLDIEEKLNPLRTYNTRLVGELFVSQGPVSPNKLLIIGGAMLLGAIGAIFLSYIHYLFATRRSQS